MTCGLEPLAGRFEDINMQQKSKSVTMVQFSGQRFSQMLEEPFECCKSVTIRTVWTCLLVMTIFGKASGNLAAETDVLLSAKAAWGNPSKLDDWLITASNSTCSWTGVTCNPINSSVMGLSLNDTSLSGEIPKNLAMLVNLETLGLAQNSLSGPVPTELGSLSKLTYLDLHQNKLNESIPEALGSLKHLKILLLSKNSLIGSIPAQLGQLSKLQKLDLSYNMLNGSSSLINISSLTNLTELYLNNNRLSGSIPVSLSSLMHLQYVTLYSNNLSGQIPQNLIAIPALEQLQIYNNNLTGPIPTNLSSKLTLLRLRENFLTGEVPVEALTLNTLTELSVEDNCLNGSFPKAGKNSQVQISAVSNCFKGKVCNSKCGGVSSGGKGKSSTARNVSIAVGVIAGLLLLVGLPMFLVRWKRTRKPLNDTPDYQVPGSVQRYTLLEVKEATKNLTTKLGEGGFATVYKADFRGGTVAAVKHFNKKKPEENFQQEVEFLAHLNHRYLVNLIGFCQEQGELMLMYDFMNRGNLYESLHGDPHTGPHKSKAPLTWDERVKILLNVARGIEYLHHGASPPLIHRDIKSANILLTVSDGKTLIAKLADFGLGKQTILESYEALGSNETPEPPPTRVAGTPGYMDPEYLTAWKVSSKSDVFSYGVVMLELVTGKQAIFIHMQARTSLVEWARPYLAGNQILTIVDPKLGSESIPESQLVSVAALVRRCVDYDSRNRPTIRGVLKTLSEIFRPDSETTELSRELSSSSGSTDITLRSLKSLIGSQSYSYFESATEMTPRSSRSLEPSSSHSYTTSYSRPAVQSRD